MRTVELFRDGRAVLIESIWWDSAAEVLRWVDITLGTLHRARLDGSMDGADDEVVRVPPPLAATHPARGGGVIAALGDRVVLLDDDIAAAVAGEAGEDADGPVAREVRELTRVAHAHPEMRLNEGKCDPWGSFLVGSMDLRDGSGDGALYRVRADGTCETLLGGFGVANGIEFSPDGRTLYVTDTAVSTVYAAPYHPDRPLGEPRPFLVGHASDGLALDSDGCFWNGIYSEAAVLRWSPDGEVIETIEIPAPNVTSVAFGGPRLDTLFVGTARENLTEEQLVEHPLSGAVFAIETGSTGRPVNVFGDPRLTSPAPTASPTPTKGPPWISASPTAPPS